MQARTNPFHDLERVFDRMSEQFDEAADWWQDDEQRSEQSPAIDLVDSGDAFTATVDVPGFDRDDITARVSGHTLTIRADHSETAETDEGRYLRRERRHRSLERTVRLPAAADPADATARLRNGVLTVTIPKQEPTETPRQLDIDLE
jgi:HSP20 family protein